jgi:hypothetical protein
MNLKGYPTSFERNAGMSLFGEIPHTPIFKPEPEYSRLDIVEAEIRGSQAMLQKVLDSLRTYPPAEFCDPEIANLVGKVYDIAYRSGYKDGKMSKARMP